MLPIQVWLGTIWPLACETTAACIVDRSLLASVSYYETMRRVTTASKHRDRDSKDHVQAVQRACRILQAFSAEGEVLRVRDLVIRTGLHKATASRLLRTLEAERLRRAIRR